MALTDALSIYLENETTKAKLKNVLAGILNNYQKRAISARLKSTNANLTRAAGSYEFKRFANASVQEYGTARAAGKGDKIVAPSITVNLDRDKEIVEEVNFFDADGSFTDEGFTQFVDRRGVNFTLSLEDYLDEQFFLTVKEGGTAATTRTDLTGAAITDIDLSKEVRPQLETLIGTFEKTGKTTDTAQFAKFVKGINRSYMALVLDSRLYGLIKDELNDTSHFPGTTEEEGFKSINGVTCFSTVNLPTGVDYVLMTMDSVAQPVIVKNFGFEKINLSNDYAMELFFRYGVKVLAPELVLYGKIKAAV